MSPPDPQHILSQNARYDDVTFVIRRRQAPCEAEMLLVIAVIFFRSLIVGQGSCWNVPPPAASCSSELGSGGSVVVGAGAAVVGAGLLGFNGKLGSACTVGCVSVDFGSASKRGAGAGFVSPKGSEIGSAAWV